jgi:hypothetical protein
MDALSWKDLPNDVASPGNSSPVSSVAALMEFQLVLSDSLKAQIIGGYESGKFCLSLRCALPLCDDCLVVDGVILINGHLLIPDWLNI